MVRIESPDVAHVYWNGDIEPEDVQAVVAVIDARLRDRFFIVHHMAHFRRISPSARKEISTTMPFEHTKAVLYVGATFQMKVVIGMISRLVEFVYQGKSRRQRLFCDSLEEAEVKMADVRNREKSEHSAREPQG